MQHLAQVHLCGIPTARMAYCDCNGILGPALRLCYLYSLLSLVHQGKKPMRVFDLQAKVEDRWNALKKKMAVAEYAGKTPAKIKNIDMENLGKAQKEQQSLEQQLHDMRQLLQ